MYVTNASGSWSVEAIDTQSEVHGAPSLGLDSLGNVHISYVDQTSTQLKYITNETGAWMSTDLIPP